MSFLALMELRGENSVSSSQPIIICVPKQLTEFFAELTEFAVKLSEASMSSLLRNSTLETAFRPFPNLHPWTLELIFKPREA